VTVPPEATRFRATDTAGLSVVLTDERWSHIAQGHPELVEIEHEIAEAVRAPDAHREGRSAGEVWCYRRLPEGSRAPWLKVVVRYREEGGWIITAFLRRRMP